MKCHMNTFINITYYKAHVETYEYHPHGSIPQGHTSFTCYSPVMMNMGYDVIMSSRHIIVTSL